MYTIFIEYPIEQHAQNKYLESICEVQKQLQHTPIRHYQFMEAIDQDARYVEMFQVEDLDVYHEWKGMLNDKDERFPWFSILPFVAGGWQRFHLWAFKSLSSAYDTNDAIRKRTGTVE